MREEYGVVIHSRWLETEEPKATVVYTKDGFIFHDICTCDPDWAREIAAAMQSKNIQYPLPSSTKDSSNGKGIVSALKWIAEEGQCDCHICDTALAAAKEIELLRAAGDQMAQAMRSGGDAGWDKAIDKWDKIRNDG